ncbi:hypothetical protein V6N12_062923 [Hibiscus sabdariffa]|uniref:Uncharacterized protein n=1 Tax=Hibiscus sabdariffa TaxID=183260 RepID=A0ABR2FAH9_9ROSI
MMKNQIHELRVPDLALQYSPRHTCWLEVHKLYNWVPVARPFSSLASAITASTSSTTSRRQGVEGRIGPPGGGEVDPTCVNAACTGTRGGQQGRTGPSRGGEMDPLAPAFGRTTPPRGGEVDPSISSSYKPTSPSPIAQVSIHTNKATSRWRGYC